MSDLIPIRPAMLLNTEAGEVEFLYQITGDALFKRIGLSTGLDEQQAERLLTELLDWNLGEAVEQIIAEALRPEPRLDVVSFGEADRE